MTGLLYCDKAKQILDAFAQATRDLFRLHNEQLRAVVAGDLESTRFDALIRMANERKCDAKYAYLHHVETHGCLVHGGAAKSKRASVQPSAICEVLVDFHWIFSLSKAFEMVGHCGGCIVYSARVFAR